MPHDAPSVQQGRSTVRTRAETAAIVNLVGIPLEGPAAACSVLPGCSLPRQGAGTARYVRTGPLLARGPVRCVSGTLQGVSRGLTCTFPQCTRCSAGTWGVGKLGNDEECLPCGVGYYSTTLGGTSAGVCQACSRGKFFNDTRGTQVRLFFFTGFIRSTPCASLPPIPSRRSPE